jgi:hypothetical protein
MFGYEKKFSSQVYEAGHSGSGNRRLVGSGIGQEGGCGIQVVDWPGSVP